MTRRLTAMILLALAAAACNRAPANNSAGAASPPAVPAPQSNVVIAPPMAPPAIGNDTDAVVPSPEEDGLGEEGCAGEIGRRAADQLVLQCRDASPATRPPCNVANSCEMIRNEIARGCALIGEEDRPEYCPVG